MSKPSPSPRSMRCDPQKLLMLRQSLGWTQNDAAVKSGYSSRVIRKLESGGSVRPATLVDVLQCYHEAVDCADWQLSDFLKPENETVIFFANDSLQNGTDNNDERQHQMAKSQEYFDVIFNQRQIDRIDEYVAENLRFSHGEGPILDGIDVVRELANNLLIGFDPIQMTFQQTFWCENTVFLYWRVSMKHVGEFCEVAATEKWVKFRGNSSIKWGSGKIIRGHDHWDVYDVLRQLEDQPNRWF